ncbi:MAG: hypothetical protein ACOYJL_09715 [Tractidigestivibacter sp.]|jgi:hypothetical protein|uniref:hypothetical protein n=1 Tax=Tractidigestivibacter sp. TaxID=2847320 RepID=UPI003D8A6255
MATKEEVTDAIINAVADTYEKDPSEITRETTFAELGVASLKCVSICVLGGENLDLDDDIEFDVIAKSPTVGEAIDNTYAWLEKQE